MNMMTIWKPFDHAPLSLENFFGDFALPTGPFTHAFAVPADILETEDELRLQLDLPGHRAADVKIQFENGALTVESERKATPAADKETYLRHERAYGVVRRSFVLPDTVDGEKIEAKLDGGVLTVRLPKKEESKPKVISVKVAS